MAIMRELEERGCFQEIDSETEWERDRECVCEWERVGANESQLISQTRNNQFEQIQFGRRTDWAKKPEPEKNWARPNCD